MTMSELMTREVRGNAIEVLHIEPQHLDYLSSLPFHYKDPFDRLMIAQSFSEDIPLVRRIRRLGPAIYRQRQASESPSEENF